MKFIIAAVLAAGVALGIAPVASAVDGPNFCSNHEEYLSTSSAAAHTKGSLYKTACAVGPGNGGNTGATANPATWH